MKTKKKLGYIHTINGTPGSYEPGQQICHAGHTKTFPVIIVPDLETIRHEQKLTHKWRGKRFSEPSDHTYGWRYIELP